MNKLGYMKQGQPFKAGSGAAKSKQGPKPSTQAKTSYKAGSPGKMSMSKKGFNKMA